MLLKTVDDVNEISSAVAAVRENGDVWFTNFFINKVDLQRYNSKREIKCCLSKDTAIVIRESDKASFMYFSTVNLDDFCNKVKDIAPYVKRPIAVEIYFEPRNAEQVELLQNSLIDIGFNFYAKQTRFIKLSDNNFYTEIDPEWYATENDCAEILDMLNSTFDSVCDKIPDIEELKSHANNKEILIAKHDGVIVSAIIFNRKPAVAEWIFWLTRPEERKSFYGLLVREVYLKLTENVRKQVAYIREEKMIRFHKKFGFRPDGFENLIFTL